MIYRVLGALSFVAVIVVGCTSDDCPVCTGGSGGATTSSPSGGSGAEGGAGGSGGGVAETCPGIAPNSDAACDECRAFECCTEAQACVAEPECAAWLECEDVCAVDDFDCVRACWSGNPASPAKAAYSACKQRSCSVPCGMEACAGPAFNFQDSDGDDGPSGECRACRNEHCCATASACLEDADCMEAFECYATCDDVECMLDVCNNSEHLPLLAKIAPDWACRSRYCLEECGGAEQCSEVFYSEGDCRTCVHDSCCAETAECSEDAECIEYVACVSQCGSVSSCKDTCAIAQPIGAGLDHVRKYCRASNCSTACGDTARTCGGFEGMQAACKTCIEASCCDEAQACGTSSECAAVYICIDACGDDTACQDECLETGDEPGVAAYQALTTCRATECATECTE